MQSRNLNFALGFVLLFEILCGCEHKSYPDEHFVFKPTFLEVFKSFVSKDTLLFENNQNSVDTFVLTKVDSSINNRKGFLINARAFKSVHVCYKQIPINYWTSSRIEHAGTSKEQEVTEEHKLISITKYPDHDITELYISFRNFRCNIQDTLGVVHRETLHINNLSISNYYTLESTAKSLVRKPTDIEVIYITLKEGLVAYREKSGRLRARIN